MALAMTLLSVWSVVYEYGGLAFDAQIYTVQALAKLRPSLTSDLFLQNVSQDRFTLFPGFYSWVISHIGLRQAALTLTVVFLIWLLTASWALVAGLTDRNFAWLGTGLLVILEGKYGAFGVFSITEPFLTARLPAEALIVTAIVCQLKNHGLPAFVIAFAAFLFHPIMALPGLMLLICLRIPLRATVTSVAILTAGTLVASVAVTYMASGGRTLVVMDAPWLEVVRERSQFLFLQQWRAKDWTLNALPLLSLAFTALVFHPGKIRDLAIVACIVAITGIAIAAISSLVGPVAVLLQGQAWRWEWIAALLSILLLLPAAYEAWTCDRFGSVSGTLLVTGWILPAESGASCALLALMVWLFRPKIRPRWTKYGQAIAVGVVILVALFSLVNSWTTVARIPPVSSGEVYFIACFKSVFASKLWCVLFVGVLWWLIKSTRGWLLPLSVFAALAAASPLLLLRGSNHITPYGSPASIREFADWRNHIPEGSTVFVTNGRDSGSFVWFTLQRNNYLSPSQSAGVVYSRATALEVERRSKVLQPLTDPNWKILTALRNRAGDSGTSIAARTSEFRPLTTQALADVCRDPLLGFVVSPDGVGFDAITHLQPGIWKNWKLYDCSHVRAQVSKT